MIRQTKRYLGVIELTVYVALPDEYAPFEMLYSQQAADIGRFDFDISALAAAY